MILCMRLTHAGKGVLMGGERTVNFEYHNRRQVDWCYFLFGIHNNYGLLWTVTMAMI